MKILEIFFKICIYPKISRYSKNFTRLDKKKLLCREGTLYIVYIELLVLCNIYFQSQLEQINSTSFLCLNSYNM